MFAFDACWMHVNADTTKKMIMVLSRYTVMTTALVIIYDYYLYQRLMRIFDMKHELLTKLEIHIGHCCLEYV